MHNSSRFRWRFLWGLFICLALALLVKHNCLFIVWALLVWQFPLRRALLWMLAVLALFALSFAPYLPDGLPAIFNQVVAYGGSLKGVYGLATILPARHVTALGLMVMLPLPLLLRRRPLTDALAIAVLGTVVFAPAFGANYFLYALALLALCALRWGIALGVLLSINVLASLTELLVTRHWLLLTMELVSYPALWVTAAIAMVWLIVRPRIRATADTIPYR